MQMNSKTCFLQGNEACAEGALAAGASFFAGYPITPATEIAEVLSVKLPVYGGKFVQMEDELSCLCAVLGASYAGAKALTATSGPGFSLMQESLGYATIAEVPCVIIDVQRGGPSTGLPTLPAQADVMQSRWGTHGDHPVIVLAPSSVTDCFYLTVEAFNLAEEFRVPVIVLSDAIVGHMREKIVVPDKSELTIINRQKPSVPPEEYLPYKPGPNGVPEMSNLSDDGYRFFRHGCPHNEKGNMILMDPNLARNLLTRLHAKITNNLDKIVKYDTKYLEDAETVVVAYGSVARTAMAAVERARKAGRKVGYFRPITLWPSPERELLELTKNAKNIIVPEMNMGQYVGEIARIYGEAGVCKNIIRINEAGSVLIHPNRILETIEEVSNR